MFAYDSSNDQYEEVFEPELYELIEPNSEPQFALIAKSFRRSSSRASLRSVKRNVITRIISKTGRLNTFLSKLPSRAHIVYFRDLGNTLLNIRWRWILITLCLVNFACFFLFGFVWMWVAASSGDFDEDAVDFCVVNTKHFVGYVLLSIETIMTIGYGYRYPTEKCKQVWIVMALQSFISVAIQGALVSAVYVKISKPFTKNAHTLFSDKAVICLRDGKLCFIIRIIDLVGKVSVGTKITMYFVDKEETANCGTDPFYVKQIKVEPHGFLIFPLEIIHVIDLESPLYQVTPFQLLEKKFEILVSVEGCSMVTGQLSQNKTSYISSDVLWGHRFSSCLDFNEKKEKFFIRRKEVNRTVAFNTPLCSAFELDVIASNLSNELNENGC